MHPNSKKPIHLIVACSENRVIGRDGGLPWRIREDLKYLQDCVKGGVVIEGRRVWQEIEKEFPGTRTVVVSRNPDLKVPENVFTATSLPKAIETAESLDSYSPIWICGGQQIYEEAMAYADRLYLTKVHTEVEGDTFFPDWSDRFSVVVSERTSSNAGYRYTFYVLEPQS